MLSPNQLLDLAGATNVLRRRIEDDIVATPNSRGAMVAFMRMTEGERAVQRDLTAASAHLAQASALLHRVADISAPVVEMMTL